MAQRCCLLHLTEQSCLLNFFKNSNFKDSGISLLVFPSRTNPELHNISVTPKIVKKVKTSFDSSERSGLDCIPVVVLKNCESELSYILAELFNMCLKESCFPDCWKVSLVFPVFVSDRIAEAFNRSGATRAVALNISKALNRV